MHARTRTPGFRFLPLFALLACAHAEPPPIQSWIDEAIKQGGGVVTIPPGEHELTQPLLLKDARKLALRGMDKEECLLKWADGAAGPAIIRIEGACADIEFANLTLRGGVSTTGGDGEAAIKGFHIRECIFEDFTGTAVRLENASACAVERSSFRDIRGSAIVFARNMQNCLVRGNHIIRCDLAFDLAAESTLTLEGNETRDCKQAIRGGDNEKSITIRNNLFSGTPNTRLVGSAAAAESDNEIR